MSGKVQTSSEGATQPREAPSCPFIGGVPFNPMDVGQVLDPLPWLSAARKEAPVFYMPEFDEWYVTKYEDVLAVVRNTKVFSSSRVLEAIVPPELADVFPKGHPLAGALINTDPPEHTRLRKLAQKAFTPKVIASCEQEVRECANRLLDEFVSEGKVDFAQRYTRPLAGASITIVAGADASKADDFVSFADNVLRSVTDAAPMNPAQQAEVAASLKDFSTWLDEFIEDRRQHPTDDLASSLVHAKSDDGTPSLSNWEVVRILANVLTAGIDTTSGLICLTMFELLRDRDRWERLRRHPELVPNVVEEMVRWANPIRGLRRTAMEDVEIGGVLIPKGSTVTLNYASAQRDEDVFEEPNSFDPERPDLGKHFGWGKGAHFCIGAPLARMEARITLEVLLERIPEIRLPEGEIPQVMPSRLGAFVVGFGLEWPVARGIPVPSATHRG
jgi:cytochrome P450